MFPLASTRYTGFAIRNYAEVRGEERWWQITGHTDRGGFRRASGRKKLDTLELLTELWRQGLFCPGKRYARHPRMSNVTALSQSAMAEQRLFAQRNLAPDREPPVLLAADLESDVVTGAKHTAFIAGYCTEAQDVRQFWGDNCVEQMLDDIVSRFGGGGKILVYFHNLKYDFSVMASDLTKILSVVKREGLLYTVTLLHRGCKVVLRDSYKLIVAPLSSFQKMFNLPQGKRECIPYTYFREVNFNLVPIADILPHLKPPFKASDETHAFLEILSQEREEGCHNFMCTETHLDAMSYYLYYHKQDCLTLMQGLQNFQAQLCEFTWETLDTEIDVLEFLTCSAFSDHYLTVAGCYDGCFELMGRLRRFVQESVRGGRVYCNPEYSKQVLCFTVMDLDARALYPSAMKRIGDTCGYPKGECKLFPAGQQWPFPETWNFYVCRIQVHAITREQALPIVSYKHNGKVVWGKVPPKSVVVNTIDLEDWIRFAGITFTVEEGVYWDNGVQHEVGSVISDLHNLRNRYRAEGNPLQNNVKLVMNAGYGKLAMKRCDKTVVIQDSSHACDYIRDRFALLKEMVEFGNHAQITLATYDTSYTRVHLGSLVLAMARRIMNEVIEICTELGIPIFYTDTDSLHLPHTRVAELAEAYFTKYGRQLLGAELGMFHTDFDIGCGHADRVVLTKALFLSPKSYCHVLTCQQCGKQDFHFRMKGIPAYSIEAKAEELDCDIFGVYTTLLDTPLTFVLNPPGHPRFKIGLDGVETLDTNVFTRTVSIHDI